MIEAIKNMVLLKSPLSQDEQSGGIVIPESAQKQASERIVVSVGEEATLHGLEAGHVVIRTKLEATEVTHGGVNYELIPEEHIIAIIGKV